MDNFSYISKINEQHGPGEIEEENFENIVEAKIVFYVLPINIFFVIFILLFLQSIFIKHKYYFRKRVFKKFSSKVVKNYQAN